MESVLYNTVDKQVAIVLGGGIKSNLTLKYLKEILADIKLKFPNLTDQEIKQIKFRTVPVLLYEEPFTKKEYIRLPCKDMRT